MAEESQAALTAAGCDMTHDPEWVDAETMARIIVWFINQGDPDIDVRLAEKASPALTQFGQFGYGLFS